MTRRVASRLAVAWRLAVSLALLMALGWWLDGQVILAQLRRLDTRWVGAAVAVSVLQIVTSAWRWRFTAGRLGLALPFGRAVREYYLAMFLNQLLPGGVAGDVSRAWRHARTEQPGPAVRAVILERASGQIVMIGVAVVSCLALPEALRRGVPIGWLVAAALSGAAVGLMTWVRRRARRDKGSATLVDVLLHDARIALFARAAFPLQLASSAVIVASYLATFVIAARAMGSTTPLGTLVPLIPLVLLTMLIPVSIAGWGVREGAAALLWAGAGLSAADGAAISAAYGLLVLLASLPGALSMFRLGEYRLRSRR